MERSTWKGTKGSLQQTEQDTEALSPTTCKEVNSVNNHMILELYLSPAKPWDETPDSQHLLDM